jgi:hypothetical protein
LEAISKIRDYEQIIKPLKIQNKELVCKNNKLIYELNNNKNKLLYFNDEYEKSKSNEIIN